MTTSEIVRKLMLSFKEISDLSGILAGLASAYPHGNNQVSITSLKNDVSRRASDSTLGIYDGESTTIQDHPYLAGILVNGEFMCAGAILTDEWVIVLADCIYDATKSKLKVVVGSSDGTTGTTYSVKTIVQHPDYVVDSFDYDYTLLRVKGAITWGDAVGNVSLPAHRPAENTALVVAGYGDTASSVKEGNAVSGGRLYQGTMKWLKRSVCSSDYVDYEITFTDRMGCAYNKGKTTLCSGDWGNPFVKAGVLYGLFAAGASDGYCTSTARPVIVADIYPVVDWIRNYTGASSSQA